MPFDLPILDLWTVATFLMATLALNLTPGPDLMFISASGASGGARAGVAAACGVSIGCFFHSLLAAVGIATLLAANPAAFDAVRYAGATYLVVLAVRAWRAPLPGEGRGATTMRAAFLRGALTNMLNPKVLFFVMAFLPQFADPGRGSVAIQILMLGALLAVASLPVNCGAGALAGMFAGWLRRFGGLANRISAIVFGALAARLVWN